MKKNVKNNVYWIGYMDWDLQTFHGDDYTIHHGSSQNAYLIQEEKTVLMDTVWAPHQFEFIENLQSEIDLNKIDYIVVNHGENDHSGSLPALMKLMLNHWKDNMVSRDGISMLSIRVIAWILVMARN